MSKIRDFSVILSTCLLRIEKVKVQVISQPSESLNIKRSLFGYSCTISLLIPLIIRIHFSLKVLISHDLEINCVSLSNTSYYLLASVEKHVMEKREDKKWEVHILYVFIKATLNVTFQQLHVIWQLMFFMVKLRATLLATAFQHHESLILCHISTKSIINALFTLIISRSTSFSPCHYILSVCVCLEYSTTVMS